MLRARNPAVWQQRVPAEIIASIENRGEEVANALRKLKALGELEKA